MALYSSLKIFGLVPFFLCSLLTLAFRHEDVHQSPDTRDHILLFSRGSAIVSLSCYLIFHLFLNITHAPLFSTAPPTSTVVAPLLPPPPPPPPPPSTHPPPLLPFITTLLATILTSRNLVHALALLPASSSSPSSPPLPPAMLAPAPLYAILLPIALNHHELLAAVRAAHLPQLRNHSPHHILAVLTEAPTVHATLFLVPTLALLGWMSGGGRDVGMEIGGGGEGGGGRGGKGGRGSASSARMAVVLLLLCGLGAWLDSVVAAGRRGGRLLVLKGWVLVSL
ncbi:hypothetical protein DIS24_g6114 [Lasiodiplodia hormozganensis]|uniref:Uncharacterized protein n=1 Tax=Lasiodiplodia hormozganensis TaxID=869390 RepID=A0AA40CVS8_9PEZI|nr:hypothetical protein DIS24_g6114 [Lasiodiplodia hormozganensis]